MKDRSPEQGFDAAWIHPRLPRNSGLRRVGALTDLRLACRAGPYDLDVLVRDMERPRGVEIIGQLTHAEDLHIPASGVEVVLVSALDGAALATARTSTFGEFTFPRFNAIGLGLRLGPAADAATVLVWDRRP